MWINSESEFYLKSKVRLSLAGFNLRKFVTNSNERRDLIQKNELAISGRAKPMPVKDSQDDEAKHTEEDQSYAKSSLGVKLEEKQGIHKILDVQWVVNEDEFLFDLNEVSTVLENSSPTKRSVVKITANFFGPLGVV